LANRKPGRYDSAVTEIVYRKPPLVEAVCEFRFVSGDKWDPTVPGLLFSAVSSYLPKKGVAARFNLGATAESPFPQVAVTELVRFSTEDEKQFVQLAPNFLTVNCLAPYVGWSAYSLLVQRTFDACVEVARPKGIQRLGLRYVNAISFPEPQFELSDFFKFYPFVDKPLPQQLVGAKAEVHFLEEGSRDVLSLRMYTVPPKDSDPKPVVVLDMDYHLNEAGTVSLTEALDWMNTAHGHVLNTFRACLTESLERRFEPA
jgi:uncharacterized protein (TIGR04255 family)